MADKTPNLRAHMVYPPPHKGLPYLAVTLQEDGTVVAQQFDSVESADRCVRQMIQGTHQSPHVRATTH